MTTALHLVQRQEESGPFVRDTIVDRFSAEEIPTRPSFLPELLDEFAEDEQSMTRLTAEESRCLVHGVACCYDCAIFRELADAWDHEDDAETQRMPALDPLSSPPPEHVSSVLPRVLPKGPEGEP